MTATVIAGVHPVHEALKSGRAVDRVSIAKGAGGARLPVGPLNSAGTYYNYN